MKLTIPRMMCLSLMGVLLSVSSSEAFTPRISVPNHRFVSSPLSMQKTTSSSVVENKDKSKDSLWNWNFGKSPKKKPNNVVVIDSDYSLSYAFIAVGIFILLTSPVEKSCSTLECALHPSIWGILQGSLNMIFGVFLAVQAKRIRFVFDDDAFELKNVSSSPSSSISSKDVDNLKKSGENFVVGGENRWRYDTFVNYDFFPSVNFPILVYFKETQTPREMWSTGPGSLDKIGGGQVHFFPAIANVKQLKEQFEARGCAKVQK